MNAHSHTRFENVDQEAGLPNGRYLMEIVESDAVNHGSATDLVLTAEVTRGDHAGKRIAFRLLLDVVQDPDDDTVDAEFSGRDIVEYASLCRATGLDNPTFVEDFHNRPFSALVSGRGRKQVVAGFEGPEFGIKPANDDAPAPKQAKPTPARGPDGRFLPRGHAEPEAGVEEADQPESAANSTTPSEPEAVPYERWSEAWQRADRYNVLTHNISMLWRLLSPKIEDDLGRATGPLNGVLKGGGEGLYVLAKEDVEVLDYHLLKLGELIDDLVAVDAA